MKLKTFCITITLLSLPLSSAFAVPEFLSHQGQIIQPDNTPMSGSVNMSFEIFATPTGGSALWAQTMAVTFDDGYYSVVLGPGQPALSTVLFDDSDMYLGITMEGNEEFTPRRRITSVPYAMVSGAVTGEVNAVGGLFVDGEEVVDSLGNMNIPGTIESGSINLLHTALDDLPSASSENTGQLVYVPDEGTLYYSNGSNWVEVGVGGSCEVQSPVIDSLSPSQIEPEQDVVITIDGQNFMDGCEVEFGDIPSSSVTFVNENRITASTGSEFSAGLYSVKIISPNGLRNTLSDGLSVDSNPVWETPSGNLGNLSESASGEHFTLSATDAESQQISYSLTDGDLPAGLSLDSNTGVIYGDPESVENNTEYSFQITASDTARSPNLVAREFTIVIVHKNFDGDETVSESNVVINSYAYITDSTLSAGGSTINVNDASDFSQGDEIMVIQMQHASNAGMYEFSIISAVSSNEITLDGGLVNDYYSGTFNTSNAEAAQIVRVPNYGNVTVSSGNSITATAWNGYSGGIVIFSATDTVTIEGSITVEGQGFRPGAQTGCNDHGYQGEGYRGTGTKSTSENYGGGGGSGSAQCSDGGAGGSGGGGYGVNGSTGNPCGSGCNQGGSIGGNGGSNYGADHLATLYLGGGAGSDGRDDNCGNYGGPCVACGGPGGGIIKIMADTINISGTINANSANNSGSRAQDSVGAASGAGGSIHLSANTLSIGTNKVTSVAGAPGANHWCGGSPVQGAVGRIRIDGSLSGTSNPTAFVEGE